MTLKSLDLKIALYISTVSCIRWQIPQLFSLITAQPLTAYLLLFFFFFAPPWAAFQGPSCHESFLWLPLLPSPSWPTYASNTDRGVNLPEVIKTASFVAQLLSSSSHPWWHNGVKSISNGLALGRTQVCNTISCWVDKKRGHNQT